MPKAAKVIVDCLQSLLFPAFIVMEFFLLLMPICWYNQQPTFQLLSGLYEQALPVKELLWTYWADIYLFYWKMWLLQLIWAGFMFISGIRAEQRRIFGGNLLTHCQFLETTCQDMHHFKDMFTSTELVFKQLS